MDNEAHLAEYEREITRDLDGWRQSLVQLSQLKRWSCSEQQALMYGSTLGEQHPAVRQTLYARLDEYVCDVWREIDGAPVHEGIITIDGSLVWYGRNAGELGDALPEMLPPGIQLSGKMLGCGSLPYVMEVCLKNGDERQGYDDQILDFGVHILLSDACLVDRQGRMERIETDIVTVPLNYKGLRIATMSLD